MDAHQTTQVPNNFPFDGELTGSLLFALILRYAAPQQVTPGKRGMKEQKIRNLPALTTVSLSGKTRHGRIMYVLCKLRHHDYTGS